MTGRLGMSICVSEKSLLISYHLYRSFVNAWQSAMKTHETMAENRIRFAQRLNEMSEELNNLSKEVEKTRKQVGDILALRC